MSKLCIITVFYLNGTRDDFFGGLHVDEKMLRIYPQQGTTVCIPLTSIHKYTVSEGKEASPCLKKNP